jgi:CDP-glycerol glycerophosphotransferase (TagB/SpsB family)
MPSEYLKLKISGIDNVFYVDNLFKALYIYLFSKIVFVDSSSLRIKPSKKQCVLNLWHGTPLKSIGFMSHAVERDLPRTMMNAFSMCCISSENFRNIFQQSFNADKKQFVVLGQPRLDLLFNNYSVIDKLGIDRSKYNNIYMWMTTYRFSYDGRIKHAADKTWSDTNLPILINGEKIETANKILQLQNDYLIIKVHQISVFDRKYIKQYSNILFILDTSYIYKDIQLYEILKDCDCLFTDYSSVYFDYLLLDRPIVFLIPDITEYMTANGFVFDNPLEFMPGIYIHNDIELFDLLAKKNFENDEIRELRKIVNTYVNFFRDNNNCKRILDFAKIYK